ncbi:MAG TPA: aldo/keto reductase [Candidatus Lokiarchaeia archaeon]|nr:aldo/keto reductase [Candidatus Lokiarchaeia archaeon]
MDRTILGRTGLDVSVMGLGGGGHSRFGKGTGHSDDDSIAIIRQALDAGINFIDTAELYYTEKLVGQAIEGRERQSIAISTKKTMGHKLTESKILTSLDASITNLGVEFIDIYNFHAVTLKQYDSVIRDLLPVFQEAKDRGKIRFIGITEFFDEDPGHEMLQRAMEDDCWDVIMTGFNILNQSARDRVLKKAIEKNIGVLVMFAVRNALSNTEYLRKVIHDLVTNGKIDPSTVDLDDPLGFLVHDGGATSITDAAYRFCRYESGTHVILSGTGNSAHLDANIESFSRPPLPQEDVDRLRAMFEGIDSITGE